MYIVDMKNLRINSEDFSLYLVGAIFLVGGVVTVGRLPCTQ